MEICLGHVGNPVLRASEGQSSLSFCDLLRVWLWQVAAQAGDCHLHPIPAVCSSSVFADLVTGGLAWLGSG